MDLLMPSTGLLFWMTIVFLVVLAVLWKWGFCHHQDGEGAKGLHRRQSEKGA